MTRQMRRRIGTLAIIASAAVSGQAAGQAFSFNVPLDVKDIHPKYTYVQVFCKVVDAGGVDEVGHFATYVALQSHAFNGILSVPVDPGAGKSALDGKNYFCNARYCTAQNDASCVDARRMDVPENKVQPGAPFAPEAHGAIP